METERIGRSLRAGQTCGAIHSKADSVSLLWAKMASCVNGTSVRLMGMEIWNLIRGSVKSLIAIIRNIDSVGREGE